MISRWLGRARRGLARFVVFFWAVARYDTFVIGGAGFWSGRELPVLRWLGKRVVWVFLGTDHRPPYLSGKFIGRGLDSGALRRETARTAARVRRVERWAHAIVAHEASAQFHRRPFVRLLEIGLPILADAAAPKERPNLDRPAGVVKVLHCPTDPVAKGSARIREIVGALGTSGSKLEYAEVVGRPHGEVLDALARSDVAIDELYGDTPLGVFAAEAGWFATPSVCGGYFADGRCRPLDDGSAFPAVFVPPNEFEGALARLVAQPRERERVGTSAQAFVQARWTPDQVAVRMRAVIADDVPAGWMVDPATVAYLDGYGLSRADRIVGIRAFVQREGERALALGHRPDLVRALLAEIAAPDR